MTFKTILLLFSIMVHKDGNNCNKYLSYTITMEINNLQGEKKCASLIKTTDSIILFNDHKGKKIGAFNLEKNTSHLCDFIKDFMEMDELYSEKMIGGEVITISLKTKDSLIKRVTFDNYKSPSVQKLDSIFYRKYGYKIYTF